MLKLCKEFECGEDQVAPNVHLHMHIKDCILDYGPICSFLLFSFERYNGVLGRLPIYNRHIESLILAWLCCENLILHLDKPQQYEEYFVDIFNDFDGILAKMAMLNKIDLHDMATLCKISSKYVFI